MGLEARLCFETMGYAGYSEVGEIWSPIVAGFRPPKVEYDFVMMILEKIVYRRNWFDKQRFAYCFLPRNFWSYFSFNFNLLF